MNSDKQLQRIMVALGRIQARQMGFISFRLGDYEIAFAGVGIPYTTACGFCGRSGIQHLCLVSNIWSDAIPRNAEIPMCHPCYSEFILLPDESKIRKYIINDPRNLI